MVLAFAGVVGLWGIGFFSFDLIRTRLPQALPGPGADARQEIVGKLTFWNGITSLLQNAGAFFGIYAFARITAVTSAASRRSRSRSCWPRSSTAFTFWFLDAFWQIFVLIPIMGFCQLALFGGYAIYFPELFPTRLRSTGTSFCYNVGRRLVAAAGPSVLGLLTSRVFSGLSRADAVRRRDHVRRLPARPARPAVRARDQGAAAAGIGDKLRAGRQSTSRAASRSR